MFVRQETCSTARSPVADVPVADVEAQLSSSTLDSCPKRSEGVRSFLPQAMFACRRVTKIICLGALACVFLVALSPWPDETQFDNKTQGDVLAGLFAVGLVLVVLEDHVDVNKSAIMLLVSGTMWTFLAVTFNHEKLEKELNKGLIEVGGIILFLLPAMGVVESIDHFDGFAVVAACILKLIGSNKQLLMPILCFLCFFLSAIIDNMTATIVCLKILRRLAGDDRHWRHAIGGLVVIAANAGGAWSPVGDVTTTMLWIQHKISTVGTIVWLFFPSFVAGVLPMLGIWWQASRDGGNQSVEANTWHPVVTASKVLVLVLGICSIFCVPMLKMAVGLPPYVGMMIALGIMWFVTDTHWFGNLAGRENSDADMDDTTPRTPAMSQLMEPSSGVVDALHKMDLTGLIFFAGVLLAVAALDTAGVLERYAASLIALCGNSRILISLFLGVFSAVVDNVPLVQAAIHMFPTTPHDDPLWQLVALAAGTGGSLLSVGSIAGVMLMTMEGVGYCWYLRKVSLWALVGFLLGLATYEAQRAIWG